MITIGNEPGDGSFEANIQLNDANGGSIAVVGELNPEGTYPTYQQALRFTGSPLTAPTAPATGLNYWIIEVDTTSGALAIQQSVSGPPANSPNAITIFSQIDAPSNTDDALNGTNDTPDIQ